MLFLNTQDPAIEFSRAKCYATKNKALFYTHWISIIDNYWIIFTSCTLLSPDGIRWQKSTAQISAEINSVTKKQTTKKPQQTPVKHNDPSATNSRTDMCLKARDLLEPWQHVCLHQAVTFTGLDCGMQEQTRSCSTWDHCALITASRAMWWILGNQQSPSWCIPH